MWRFIGVLSLLLLPCAIQGYENTKPCPENKVCVIFYNAECKRPGLVVAQPAGVVFDEATTCWGDENTFTSEYLYGRLDIEVLDPYTWAIHTTLWELLVDVKFFFAGSDLTFSGKYDKDPTAIFSWGGKRKEFKMENGNIVDKKRENQFTLNLTEERVNIYDVVGDRILFHNNIRASDGEATGEVKPGEGFAEKMRSKIPCSVSDLHEADPCIGDCTPLTQLKLTGLITTQRFCQKTLWYHIKDEDPESKNWAKVDGILCNFGHWELDKNGGASEKIGDSIEFQCSEFTPTHPFPMGAKIGLAIGGGIGLLVLMGVVGFFIWRHFERKDAKTASAMGIVTGFRPQDLPKGYLDKPKSMRNDLPIGSARTPGDEGTQKEKDAGTPASPADTPTPDNKP